MTPDHRDDSLLDAAIDRAVRDMMSAEPRADLRTRVMAELAGEPPRSAWWPRLAVASAALVVAIVALLTFVNRPTDRPVDQTIVSAPPASVPSNQGGGTRPSAGATPAAEGEAILTRHPRTTAVAGRDVAEGRPIEAASIDPVDALGIEPLTTVERLRPLEPIGIARLEAPLVVPPAISIPLITIEPIEITPLTPPR
jgi:hypothetical protein